MVEENKPRQTVTFRSLTAKNDLKFKVTIEIFHENICVDNELLDIISKYFIRHGGLYWSFEQK